MYVFKAKEKQNENNLKEVFLNKGEKKTEGKHKRRYRFKPKYIQ